MHTLRSSCLRAVWGGACGLVISGFLGCGGGGGGLADTVAPATRSAAAAEVVSPQSEALQQEGARLNAAELARAQLQAAPSPAVAAAQRKAFSRVAVYRFYNRRTGAHFYTNSTDERDAIVAQLPQMALEGTAFYASAEAATGLSPVHRFYNRQTGVHFYTISEEERDLIQARLPQFSYEGVAYHASKVAGPGLRPLYRSYLPSQGVHFYSTDPNETAGLPQYQAEGLAYHVLGGDPTTVTLAYAPDDTTVFANPERGLYRSNGSCSYAPSTLAQYRSEHISLVFCQVDLTGFANTDIDPATLNALQDQLAALRNAGMKAILRAAYSWVSADTLPRDAPKAQMLRHIAQLAPILQQNADVIATVQAGLIGTWGEWYYTDHFGSLGVISDAQWVDRREIVNALLQALPPERAIQLRTPAFKRYFFGNSALTPATAFSGTASARVGHHNDCFLASESDFGTYTNAVADKAYLAQDNLFVPQGGETCAVSAYSGWANAELDMATLRYSYLNASYNADVLTPWGSNIDSARRRLGYRLMLTSATLPVEAAVGGPLGIELVLTNKGYAAPYNPRRVELVLRHTTTGALHRFALDTDPRRWAPGTSVTVRQTVTLGGLPAGSYAMLLNLPDPAPTLSTRAAYAIRLANSPSAWDGATGFNALNHLLVVR